MAEFTRRSVLRAGGTVVGAVTAGCVLNNPTATGGHLYLDSRLRETVRLGVVVEELETDDTNRIVDGVFRLPPDVMVQFESVIEAGTTYRIVARQLETEQTDRLEIPVESCPEGSPSTQLDVSVFAGAGGPGIVTYGCDRGYVKEEDVEYVGPEEYRVGTVEGTVTTAS